MRDIYELFAEIDKVELEVKELIKEYESINLPMV